MPEDGVYMDIDAVNTMANRFKNISDVLRTTSRLLEIATTTLRATAFIGLVGNAVVERYMTNIKPPLDRLAEKCAEINIDLLAAVQSYTESDLEGKTKFEN
jgi:hypothetical protein